MVASARFGASKFRNATSSATPTETWYRSNLPAAASSTSTSSSLSTFSSEIKTNRRWIVTVTPSGEVSWRGYSEGPIGSMKVGNVGDWDLSRLEDESLALGGTDGILRVYTLPAEVGGGLKEENTISVGSPITTVSLHPFTPSLVLVAATQTPLSIYDVSSDSNTPAFTLEVEEPKGLWTAGWSNDGTRVAAVGRSGKGYIFDPRQSTKPVITKALPLQPLKPVRLVWVDDKVFLTGWDRSRNRLYTLLNPSDLSTVFTQNLDNNLSPLLAIVDEERKIVYLAGRGDMKLRQVELGGVTGFQETIHVIAYALASTSLAPVHPTHLDVMQAEIGRVLMSVVNKDGDAILPLGIKVPRRQLIDYHEDLYPDIVGSIAEQSSKEWLEGGDARPLPWALDPARRSTWEARLAEKKPTKTPTSSCATKVPVASDALPPTKTDSISKPEFTRTPSNGDLEHQTPVTSSSSQEKSSSSSAPSVAPTNITSIPVASAETPTANDRKTSLDVAEPKAAEVRETSSQEPQTDAAGPSPQATSPNVATSKPSPKAQPTASKGPQSSFERYNPGWSRKFLAGKTPLIPTYDAVPPLSSLHQDSIIFKINANLAFFPVQGPGGRLGVHPLKKKGRMVNGGEGYLSGGVEIADFDIEPFGQRVAIAGEDGLVRLWTVGEDGIQGVGPEAEQVIKGDGIDKIATIAFHPTAKDLLTVLTNDQGTCAIRLFDLKEGKEVKKIPLDLDGAFNMIWSPLGNQVAVATKDGRILSLDPLRPETQAVGPAHDSPRSFQISWLDGSHLLSVGFSKGSQRRINLYQITDHTIKTISSFMMDISPSVLFPQYDPDTHILYVWGKGERQIQAFEIRPENDLEPIAKLPSFTSGSPQLGVAFFPKRLVDVKKVEVAKVLRLTAKAIEEVSFTIPRNKPEFFQDDIYVDTLDLEHSTSTISEWLDKKNVEPQYISLKAEGMISLSQAPKTDTAAKKKFVPAANVMSEEERKRKEMNDLFQRAKMDESSDEDEPKRSGLPPPDDDW